jgi:hypothetical protein
MTKKRNRLFLLLRLPGHVHVMPAIGLQLVKGAGRTGKVLHFFQGACRRITSVQMNGRQRFNVQSTANVPTGHVLDRANLQQWFIMLVVLMGQLIEFATQFGTGTAPANKNERKRDREMSSLDDENERTRVVVGSTYHEAWNLMRTSSCSPALSRKAAKSSTDVSGVCNTDDGDDDTLRLMLCCWDGSLVGGGDAGTRCGEYQSE